MEQLIISGVEPAPAKERASSRKPKQPTRGDYYGIKPNALARDARAKLAKMRRKLEKLPEPWLDTDPMLDQAITRALDALAALAQQFANSAEYLSKQME